MSCLSFVLIGIMEVLAVSWPGRVSNTYELVTFVKDSGLPTEVHMSASSQLVTW